MTLNKFCPVAQGEYYNIKSPDKSQLFFTYFFIIITPLLHFINILIFFAIRTQHLLFCIHNMNYSPHLGLQRSSRSSIDALEGFAVT